jgi:hypothetical protein
MGATRFKTPACLSLSKATPASSTGEEKEEPAFDKLRQAGVWVKRGAAQ